MPQEKVLGAPSISRHSLPFSLSSSLFRALASYWTQCPGIRTPGFAPSSLPSLPSPCHPVSLHLSLSLSLSLHSSSPLPTPSGSRTPRSQCSPPPSPGGDSGLRVTGARPLPPSLPGWRARTPLPRLPGLGEEMEGERPRRRTKGPGRPPPHFPQPHTLSSLTLSIVCWELRREEGPGSAPLAPSCFWFLAGGS